ncbi:hypothetical protein [Algivirga pacifica]|uniref:hypothetical protein n=1 Tax=Algivirga pacifica TaxID=1162670 RepID=UPI0031EEA74C
MLRKKDEGRRIIIQRRSSYTFILPPSSFIHLEVVSLFLSENLAFGLLVIEGSGTVSGRVLLWGSPFC